MDGMRQRITKNYRDSRIKEVLGDVSAKNKAFMSICA